MRNWHVGVQSVVVVLLYSVVAVFLDEPLLPFSTVLVSGKTPLPIALWRAIVLLCAYVPSLARVMRLGRASRGSLGVAAVGIGLIAIAGLVSALDCASGLRCKVDAESKWVQLSAEARVVSSGMLVLGVGSFLHGTLHDARKRRIGLAVLALLAVLRLFLVAPYSTGVVLLILGLELLLILGVHAQLWIGSRRAGLENSGEELRRRGIGTLAIEVALVLLLSPILAAALTPTAIVLKRLRSVHADRERVVDNYSGATLCAHRARHYTPTSVSALTALVRDATSVSALGGRHSWSANACPSSNGITVDMRAIRHISRIREGTGRGFRVGAGATIGSLNAVLYHHNLALGSNYHAGVTVGGAVATSVAHLGRSLVADHVQSLQCLLPNASLVHVDRDAPAFGLVVGATGHSGCLITEVHIEALPRRRWWWTTAHYAYEPSVLTDWIQNRSRSSILWVRPVAHKATLHTAHMDHSVDLPMSDVLADPPPRSPLMARPHFATPSLSFDVYSQLLALALALAWPLVRQVARDASQSGAEAFIDEYTQGELSRPDLKPTKVTDDTGSTQFATYELEVVQHTSSLPACVQAWVAALEVADAPLHLRWAPSSATSADLEPERSAFASRPALPLSASGDDLVKLDVSLPLPMLQKVDLAAVQAACPVVADAPPHAGKLTLADVAEMRLWRRPRAVASVPPGGTAAFEALQSQWDPTRKFGPSMG